MHIETLVPETSCVGKRPKQVNVLASAIGSTWGIQARLDELPASPVWAIKATTAETGKRASIENGN